MKIYYWITIFVVIFSFSESVIGLQCYTCTPDDKHDCRDSQNSKLAPCTDNCFIVYDKEKTYRGCNATTNPPGKDVFMCTEDKCNSQTYPINCFQCSGESCSTDKTSWKLTKCTGGEIPSSGCYVKTTNTKQVERGCFDKSKPCEKKDGCEKCVEDACNSQKIITTGIECYSCDSNKNDDDGKACVTKLPKATCQSDKYCVIGFHKDTKKFYRGCEAQDKDDIVKTCEGKECNSEIALSCYKCSSKDDPHCTRFNRKSDIKTESCKLPSSVCMTAIVNGDVQRGCDDEIECNDDGQTCIPCKTTNCNDITLERDVLKCQICTNCTDRLPISKAITCSDQDFSSKCFMYKSESGAVVRGCTSDVTPNVECKKLGTKCFTSPFSGGNSFAYYTNFSCVSCSGSDPACAWSQEEAPRKICNYAQIDENPSCYVKGMGNGLAARGCSNEKNLTCDAKTCTLCYDTNCNSRGYFTSTCVQCDSDTDPNCATDKPGNASSCLTPVSYNLRGCYTLVNGNIVRRGCVADLPENYRSKCQEGTPYCHLCDGVGCNNKIVEGITCLNCTSENNKNCAKLDPQNCPTIVKCAKKSDSCVTTTIDNGITVRGCAGDFRCDLKQNNCRLCSINNCNTDILPKDRAQCYRCSGDTDCDNEQNQKNLLSCDNPSDRCFTYVTSDRHIVRGCTSDNQYEVCKTGQQINCHVTDEPNSQALYQKRLICAQCQDYDKDCHWDQSKKSMTNCTFFYYETRQCYTNKFNDTLVARGCGNSQRACKEFDKSNCAFCNSDECNRNSTVEQTCVQCLSSDAKTKNCGDKSGLTADPCKDTSSDIQGCYISVINKIVKRGCAASLNATDLAKCKSDEHHCKLCVGMACNDGKIPGSASLIKIFSPATILAVASFIIFARRNLI